MCSSDLSGLLGQPTFGVGRMPLPRKAREWLGWGVGKAGASSGRASTFRTRYEGEQALRRLEKRLPHLSLQSSTGEPGPEG